MLVIPLRHMQDCLDLTKEKNLFLGYLIPVKNCPVKNVHRMAAGPVECQRCCRRGLDIPQTGVLKAYRPGNLRRLCSVHGQQMQRCRQREKVPVALRGAGNTVLVMGDKKVKLCPRAGLTGFCNRNPGDGEDLPD